MAHSTDPVDVLTRHIRANGATSTDRVAARLGVDVAKLCAILGRKTAMDAGFARRAEIAYGIQTGLLMRLQALHPGIQREIDSLAD